MRNRLWVCARDSRCDRRAVVCCLTVLILFTAWGGGGVGEALGIPMAGPPFEVCFAPGASPVAIAAHYERLASRYAARSAETAPFVFWDRSQWSVTASQPGGGLSQGDPTTLTWSIVPDGTPLAGCDGEQPAGSDLIARLDALHGCPAAEPQCWRSFFRHAFASWAAVTGVTFIEEPADDGRSWSCVDPPAGARGLRGDIRIGGHLIDGLGAVTQSESGKPVVTNVQAYGSWVTGGIVFDTYPGEPYLNGSDDEALSLRSVIAHEIGHTLGLLHVCPLDGSKLMEATRTAGVVEPRFDDRLGAQRGYGDASEPNDDMASATWLGSFDGGRMEEIERVSIDDTDDQDYFRLSVGGPHRLSVALTPPAQGAYPMGTSAACGLPTLFDPQVIHDLGFELYDSGGLLLAAVDSTSAGSAERLEDFVLDGAGDYFLRVHGSVAEMPQAYGLSIGVDPLGSAPRIVVEPEDLAVGSGATAHFRVEAVGTSPLVYQWLRDGVALADGGGYAGTGTSRLTVEPAGADHEGVYRCRVENSFGQALSAAATLSVDSCRASPQFGGISEVTAFAGRCELRLDWQAAVTACGNGVRYRVFRAYHSGIQPAEAYLVAEVDVVSYVDRDVLDHAGYFYLVRAVDGETGVDDGNLVIRQATGRCPQAGGSFTATPSGSAGQPLPPGTPVTLDWEIPGAQGVQIVGVGGFAGAAGSVQVFPRDTTTYTAFGGGGQFTVEVYVEGAAGEPLPFAACDRSCADAVEIDGDLHYCRGVENPHEPANRRDPIWISIADWPDLVGGEAEPASAWCFQATCGDGSFAPARFHMPATDPSFWVDGSYLETVEEIPSDGLDNDCDGVVDEP